MNNTLAKTIYQVLLPVPFDFGFSYFAPDNLALEIGDVVKVSFRNKELFGVVVGFDQLNKIDEKKTKTIISIKEKIKFSSKLLEFIDWMSAYNLAPKGLVLKLSLAILNNSKEAKKKNKEQQKLIEINLKSLSTNQQKVADFLLQKISEQKFSTILLDGATGSGKTEVYFQGIAKILERQTQGFEPTNKTQILILLPEIALTSQLCKRFAKQFGFEADLWHSKISPAKKRDLFFKIVDGSCRVLIGARSALFLPFKNLQLIVVDEEHDASFKQEDVVNYNGRDMAIMRAKIENFPIILSSATPCLESYLNAKNGKYHLITLAQRFGQEQKTEIVLQDMRKEKLPKDQFISYNLKTALEENLNNSRQSLLFLNRRGYAPLTLCKKCGQKIACNNCSSYLTFHQRSNCLTCHHCGFSKKLVNICPNCGEKDCLINCGLGVEKLKEELQAHFPTAQIGLMTSDTIVSIKDAENLIEQILEHKIDIIIGTQMIAKGHHFPSLALVGIVDGDASFLGGALRNAERSYQLLTQVIGRAGREHFAGKVILQTYNPENLVFKSIIEGKRDEFLEGEIKNRQLLEFPPFSKMAAIIFSGIDEIIVISTAKEVLKGFPINQEVQVFGPAPLAIVRVKNRFQYSLNVKVSKKINLQKLLVEVLKNFKIHSSVRVKIDIDPL